MLAEEDCTEAVVGADADWLAEAWLEVVAEQAANAIIRTSMRVMMFFFHIVSLSGDDGIKRLFRICEDGIAGLLRFSLAVSLMLLFKLHHDHTNPDQHQTGDFFTRQFFPQEDNCQYGNLGHHQAVQNARLDRR